MHMPKNLKQELLFTCLMISKSFAIYMQQRWAVSRLSGEVLASITCKTSDKSKVFQIFSIKKAMTRTAMAFTLFY